MEEKKPPENIPAQGEPPVAPAPADTAGAAPAKAKNPNRSKWIALICSVVAVFLVLGTVLIVQNVRNRRPPELDEIRARIEELITASRPVNEILFGEGVPTYERIYQPVYTLEKYKYTYKEKEYTRNYYTFSDRDGRTILKYQYCLAAGIDEDGDGKADHYEYPDLENGGFLTVEYVNDYRYAEVFYEEKEDAFYRGEKETDGEKTAFWLVHTEYTEPFYYTAEDDLNYDYVKEDAPYQTVDEIKRLAETVYSSEYLASVYESLFTGITVAEGNMGTLLARYAEVEMEDGYVYLMKSNQSAPINVNRVFDFSTMKMVKPSNKNYVNVQMETYLEGDEANRVIVRVSLKLENGQWMLDSPTY